MQNLKKRITGLLICLLCALSLFPTSVFAAGAIDTEKDVSLTIQYTYDNKAIPNAEFSIYQVGTVDAYGKITLTSTYAGYPIATDGLDAEGWNALALTLSGYVQRDKLPALDSGKTYANGVLTFPCTSSVSMKPGLYLVIGKNCTVDTDIYTAAPFLVYLPAQDLASNTWSYQATVTPKCERQDVLIERKVLKIWADAGNEAKRPDSITVRLFKDGTEFDVVTLNKENNWRYTWSDLSAKYNWTIAEDAVAGYTVEVNREGITFTLKNTYTAPKPPVDPPKPPQVPQTGQLWWPVPILALVGACLVLIGILRKRKNSYEA